MTDVTHPVSRSTPAQPRSGEAQKLRGQRVTMAHGSGGKAMRDLIQQIFVRTFDHPLLHELEDQAVVPLQSLQTLGDRLAFTTDSYVVHPLFFPGGNIGELAVNGTVNDLAVGGARPLYLSCGMVLEEGLDIDVLAQIAEAMKRAADDAGVGIVTGDTKVVERGAADKLFINTSGVGVVPSHVSLSTKRIRPGAAILTNGYLGDHGVAILLARNELALAGNVESDTQPLHGLVARMFEVCPDICCLRDATRGGIATVLNEFAVEAGMSLYINEASLPIRESVRGACEVLGLDPLYLANEGKLVAVVPAEHADAVLDAMRGHAAGRESAIIGTVQESPAGAVVLSTAFGGTRIVDMLVGEQLPRIC